LFPDVALFPIRAGEENIEEVTSTTELEINDEVI
jgi:hypothetical protein